MGNKRWDDDAVNEVLKSIRANTSFGGGVKEWKLRLPNGFEIDTAGDSPEHHRQGLEALQQASALFAALPVAAAPAVASPAGPTLAEAMENYAEVEAKRMLPNTWEQRQRAFKSFSAAVGAKVRVGAVTREMASRWADGLIRAGNSEYTAKNAVSHVSQLFAALESKGLVAVNPVRGVVKVPRRDRARRRADGYAWEAFDPEQLRQIFAPENFQHAGPEHVRWGLLIGLYTGARVGEIAQLFCRDFVERDGVKCILIRADSDGQRVKTGEAGERIVPIHPDLIRLGLWKRVEQIAQAQRTGELRLFPGMRIDSKAGKGNSISKGFTYYLGKLGIKARRANGTIGTHSLRKTVIQTLQGYKPLTEERRRALMGHEPGEDVHSTNYMRPWTAGELRSYERGLKWGEWLDFDGLIPLLQTVTLTHRPKPRPSRKPARPNRPG